MGLGIWQRMPPTSSHAVPTAAQGEPTPSKAVEKELSHLMTSRPRNTDVSAPPTHGKAKCTVSGTQTLPQRRRGGSGCPAWAPAGHPTRNKDRERTPGSVQLAPVSGPVCREVRLFFGSVWRREGRGQVKRTRTEDREGGSGGSPGTGPGQCRRGRFGASLPQPQFNQSRGRE